MPYIKIEHRKELESELISLLKETNFEEGEMNYIITFLLHEFVIQNDLCYRFLSEKTPWLALGMNQTLNQP